MAGGRPAEVFLSHSSRNKRFAARLVGLLRAHGVPVWYATTSIVGAKQWHDEIGAALARCDWFLVLLSKSAVKAKWVKRELTYALRKDRYEDRIVPLRYRSCNADDLSWTLEGFQDVDFSGPFDTGARELLRMWGIGFDPDSGAVARARKKKATKRKAVAKRRAKKKRGAKKRAVPKRAAGKRAAKKKRGAKKRAVQKRAAGKRAAKKKRAPRRRPGSPP